MDIHALQQEGLSIRAISRQTGHSRNTIRKVLREKTPKTYQREPRPTKLDPFKDYLRERYEAYQLSATRLHHEITQMGFTGSEVTVRRFIQTLKTPSAHLVKATLRFETPPGKQAQVDWADCGTFIKPDGSKQTIYAFVMVLGYSRFMYVEFTTSMKLPVLLSCHQNAFEAMGGWTQTILYDNMKQVRISRSKWNERFLDFAHHYGFEPKTHQVYRPRTKGKVERMVDYLKTNFLKGREFDDLGDLNAQAKHWLEHTANARVHSTTGAVPSEQLAAESLTSHQSITPYQTSDPVGRTVSNESMVHFDKSKYSVPPNYVGQKVQVKSAGGFIQVMLEDTIIAEHKQALKAGQSIVEKEHLEELWRITAQQVSVPESRENNWKMNYYQPVESRNLQHFDRLVS